MKKYLLVLATLLACGSINVSALTLGDVGALDVFVSSTELSNSGDATEAAWVSSLLGYTVTIADKNDSVASDWSLLQAPDVYGAALAGTPAYYLLKLGNGGTDLLTHYLFQNVGELGYAAIDFSAAGIDMSDKKISVDRISHVTEFGEGTAADVSEPALALLMLFGLASLMYARKRGM